MKRYFQNLYFQFEKKGYPNHLRCILKNSTERLRFFRIQFLCSGIGTTDDVYLYYRWLKLIYIYQT